MQAFSIITVVPLSSVLCQKVWTKLILKIIGCKQIPSLQNLRFERGHLSYRVNHLISTGIKMDKWLPTLCIAKRKTFLSLAQVSQKIANQLARHIYISPEIIKNQSVLYLLLLLNKVLQAFCLLCVTIAIYQCLQAPIMVVTVFSFATMLFSLGGRTYNPHLSTVFIPKGGNRKLFTH